MLKFPLFLVTFSPGVSRTKWISQSHHHFQLRLLTRSFGCRLHPLCPAPPQRTYQHSSVCVAYHVISKLPILDILVFKLAFAEGLLKPRLNRLNMLVFAYIHLKSTFMDPISSLASLLKGYFVSQMRVHLLYTLYAYVSKDIKYKRPFLKNREKHKYQEKLT